jgi:hypothetical protein
MQQTEKRDNPMDEARINALKEELKNELLMLRAADRFDERDQIGSPMFDQRTRDAIKQELLEEMRSGGERDEGLSGSWGRRSSRDLNRIKQEIKHELMQEMKEFDDYGDYRWRRMGGRLNTADRRLLDALKDELRTEIRAQQVYHDHWMRNPQSRFARGMMQDVLENAQEMGYTPSEMLQAVQQLQQRGTIRHRLTQALNSKEGQWFKWGIGTALLVVLLFPSLARSLRPLTKWVAKEAMEVSDRAQSVFSGLKEDVEDILAEAQFERAKKTIDDDVIASGDPFDPPEKNK